MLDLRPSYSRYVLRGFTLKNDDGAFITHHPNVLNLFLQQENDLKKTVDESARIRRAYSHYFDLTIVNDNLDKAFDNLQEVVERLFIEPQWVPISWVYWCFILLLDKCAVWAPGPGMKGDTWKEGGFNTVLHTRRKCWTSALCEFGTRTKLHHKAESPWSELPDFFLAHYATHNTQEVYLFIGETIF